MGGQACVFYGAAQFSKDIDFVVMASQDNFKFLSEALHDLSAQRIAVPPFDQQCLARGHAVHFRCQEQGVEGLRIDVMTRLRDLPDFEQLWIRRTTVTDPSGQRFELMAVEDLVRAKKTQRDKDWPVIAALVEGHYRSMNEARTPERIMFWLRESRSPERLTELVQKFPEQCKALLPGRPLLDLAMRGEMEQLRAALDAEMRAEQAKDREYWAPLKAELEAFRRAERSNF